MALQEKIKSSHCKICQNLLHSKDSFSRCKELCQRFTTISGKGYSFRSLLQPTFLFGKKKENIINRHQGFKKIDLERWNRGWKWGVGWKNISLKKHLWRSQPEDRPTKRLSYNQKIIECSPSPTRHQWSYSITTVDYIWKRDKI